MGDGLYRFLKWTAIGLTAGWIGWAAYDNFISGKAPGEYSYAAAERAFSDQNYDEALENYDESLRLNSDLLPALAGRAQTLIMLDRESEAVATYDELIAAQPDVAAHYANRGIALDRLGRHEQALASYERALSIDEEVGSGPNWLTRFLRNQPDKPPGIRQRSDYIREQLALPASERELSKPEVDDTQRPYKEG
jgi:tetratricopeptide (TPR) repeat protein